nr:uncharacterized protein LOC129452977 [Misgurnus anguillicaudatus]
MHLVLIEFQYLAVCHWCTNGGPAGAGRWWLATQETAADRQLFYVGRFAEGAPTVVRPRQAADFVPPKNRRRTVRSLFAGAVCHWCTNGGPAGASRWWLATQETPADRQLFYVGRFAEGAPTVVRPCQAADFVPPKNRRRTARELLGNVAKGPENVTFYVGVVTHEPVSLIEGDNVTLHTNTNDLQRDDLIEWRFGDKQDLIARINRVTKSLKIYDEIFDNVLDGRFRGKLKMNNQTGDLTIAEITTQHTGLYTLDISSETIMIKIFSVSVFGDNVKTVRVGHSVILHNNVSKKPGDEKIVWRIQHNNSPVAEIIRNVTELSYNVHDGRFKDRLQVDDQTGDLIITNITTEDFGSYEVNITVRSHTYTIHRSFSVNVKGE